ncbi:MAG: CBS domain-containing protein [Solirubrobacterales bacterium]|nr:CBS domain-containing protein [Solirubrobacterales bacterium]
MRVQEIMVTDVVTVGPETPLKEVAAMLLSRGISGVPVVDAGGRVLGIVSETDLLQKELGAAATQHGLGHLVRLRGSGGRVESKVRARTAGEAMTTPALGVGPEASARDAACLMVERHVSRLVVAEDQVVAGPVKAGGLVGILTRADLVRAFARSDEEVANEIEEMLWRDLGINHGCVTVDVRDGDVTLSGHLDERSTVEALVARAAGVPGVVSLASDVSFRLDEVVARSGSRSTPGSGHVGR